MRILIAASSSWKEQITGFECSSASYLPCDLGQVTGTSSWASVPHLSTGVTTASHKGSLFLQLTHI